MYSPRLTAKQILVWATAHWKRAGVWPMAKSGTIPDASDETWQRVDAALQQGLRGLAGSDSLARFLSCHRGGHWRVSPQSLKKR